jgi:3-methyladenine DNA glycosylase AlkD
MTLSAAKKDLRCLANKEKARILQCFFKTGPGEYAEGDVFLGITVPQIRKIACRHCDLGFKETLILLSSEIHEDRLLALLLLIRRYSKSSLKGKKAMYDAYLRHTRFINNWDLVDLSASHIVGDFLLDKEKTPLLRLAQSRNLWRRRIAVIATFHFIRNNSFDTTFVLASVLLDDKEDLIHKALGWMLREIGKRDREAEKEFLRTYYKKIPRTMLRYAIERFPEPERLAYLKGKI